MANKTKALIGFARMKDDELLVAGNTIIGAMTDNGHFSSPSPSLADVQALLDDFSNKLAVARKRGSPEDTALKGDSRLLLEEALQRLGYYVNSVAKGHLATVLSSGFPVNASATATLVPLRIESVKLTDGRQSGQVRLDFANQSKVLLYEYCYRLQQQPEEEWSERITTTSSRGNIIAPLPPGERVEVKVRAVNSKGIGDWSETSSLLVR